jgi:5-methylcytosine-specific restriction endonuclease McrA
MTEAEDRHIVTRAQAKRLGLKRYFTGKPCKHGHVKERSAPDGQCMECARLKRAEWREANRELARAKHRDWKARNPEKAKAATLAWRAKTPDKQKQYKHEQYVRHREARLAQQKEYHIKNKEHRVQRITEWQKANPDKVKRNKRLWVERNPDKVRLNGSIQAARRRNAEGRFTQDDIDRIFDAQKGRCAYCPTSLADGYDIDHIVALKNGGTNWPSNLQLCCDSCNSRKSDKDPMDFARTLGRLL